VPEPAKTAALQRFVGELARIVEEGAGHFDCVNVATCLHDLVVVTHQLPDSLAGPVTSGAEYQALVARLLGLVEQETPATKLPTVYNLFWSIANARPPIAVSERFIDGLAERVATRLREPPLPEARYVTGTLHGYARMSRGRVRPSPAQAAMLDALYATAPAVLGICSFQNLANLAYSIATLALHPPPGRLLEQIAEAALLAMPRADPQGVSNLLWAYATLRVNPLSGQLFRAALAHAGPRLEAYNAQNLANLLWALGVLEHNPTAAFLDAAAASALPRLRDFTPQHLANCAWACARLGASPLQGRFMDALLGEASRTLPALSRQNLSNMLWACVTLQHALSPAALRGLATDWAAAVLAALEAGGEAARPQHISNALWSFSRLRLNPLGGALMDAAGEAIARQPAAFSLQNMSNILLSAAIVQHPLPPAVLDVVREF
jgi:hypothetical protein